MSSQVATPSPDRALPADTPEIIFLLMGHTGAGKSHFINSATGKCIAPVNDSLTTGKPRVRGYTVDEQIYPRSRVTLIETPGLDNADKRHSDIKIMQQITSWLSTYREDTVVGGIIFLQDISQDNFSSMYANYQAWPLACLASPALLQRLAFTTGKWDLPFVKDDLKTYEEREGAMSKMPAWKKLLDRGAILRRYEGDHRSARNTIGALLDRNPLTVRVSDVREEFSRIHATLSAMPPRKPRWALIRALRSLFNLGSENPRERARKSRIGKDGKPRVTTVHFTAGLSVNLVEFMNGAQNVRVESITATSTSGDTVIHQPCFNFHFYGPTTVFAGPGALAPPMQHPVAVH